ncbi:MAG: acetyl-CoA carboxylase biotin carboxyl carrier protein subunit [Bacteroidetes bacterium]|nr:acetyl-CoA carboxylase biotin carboxyl carrier protein subunit [Bacteroidota bacterium]
MIRAKVNDKNQFDLQLSDKKVKINENEFELDALKMEEGALHLILAGKSYRVRILSKDTEAKSYSLHVNGNTYQVALSDEMDLLLNRLGLSALTSKKVNEVKAPMPGLVLKTIAHPGDSVNKGDSLLVLEAMKMENVIKAPGEGVVKSIKVKAGDKVEKNAVLIEFE